jgi:N-carbamoylputrescine amidase
MRVTVCETRSSAADEDLAALAAHVRDERSDLLLLPELGLTPWFARTRPYDAGTWAAAVAGHAERIGRLGHLGAPAVLGTRPAEIGGHRQNLAYVWEEDTARDAHAKAFLPDEEDFWEASWYERGDGSFSPTEAGGARVGFLICTELWFLEHARAHGRAGVELLAVPRCTPAETADKWLAGGRTAAVVSGAYCLSSNHGDERFGGLGWVIGPEGDVLATTSREQPFVTVDVDLDAAREAKRLYPRYVPEL